MKISVIIPAYNMGRFLAATLDSVLAQSYASFEIIVVDDGSTDDTHQALEAYKSHIMLLQQENRGVSAARNLGLAKAQGEWVQFLDADDTLLPDKFARQMAIAHPHLAIIHSGWWLMDELGQPQTTIEPYQYLPHLNLETWLFWKPMFLGAMLFRAEWVQKVGGFDASLHHAEDVDLAFRIMAAGGQAVWLNSPTAYYRQRAGSASTYKLKQVAAMNTVLDKVYALPNLPKKIKKIQPHVYYYSLLWECWQLYQAGHVNEMIPYLQQAREWLPLPVPYLWFDWRHQLQKSADDTANADAIFLQALGLSAPPEAEAFVLTHYQYLTCHPLPNPPQLRQSLRATPPLVRLTATLTVMGRLLKQKQAAKAMTLLPIVLILSLHPYAYRVWHLVVYSFFVYRYKRFRSYST